MAITKEKLVELRQRMMKHEVVNDTAVVVLTAKELDDLLTLAHLALNIPLEVSLTKGNVVEVVMPRVIDSTPSTLENGVIEWRNSKGQLHRIGGPAVEYVNGNKAYYRNGLRDREDGPAIETKDGIKVYYLKGKNVSQAEFRQHQKNIKGNK